MNAYGHFKAVAPRGWRRDPPGYVTARITAEPMMFPGSDVVVLPGSTVVIRRQWFNELARHGLAELVEE